MVESEIHFALYCTGLSAIRDNFTNFFDNENKLPEEEFIKKTLSSKNRQEAKTTCIFLKEMFLNGTYQ